MSHGATITINGTGFGSKASAPPRIYDDFSTGVAGTSIRGEPASGVGTWNNTLYSGEPLYSTARTRGVHSQVSYHAARSSGDLFNFSNGIDMPNGTIRVFIDFWARCALINNTSRNWKLWRIYAQPGFGAYTVDGIAYHTQECSGHRYTACGTDFLYPPDEGSPVPYPTNDSWFHIQFLGLLSNPAGSANGGWFLYKDCLLEAPDAPEMGSMNLINRTDGMEFREVRFMNFWSNGAQPDIGCVANGGSDIYGSCMYADNSWMRVELGNASTYDACTLREIQRPTLWTSTQINYVANQGMLSTGTAYEFVLDDDNQVINTRQVMIV